jgi:predicted enzyme related to lactoylglutathione lyase
MEIHPRESVILAENFLLLVEWYQKVLQFKIVQLHEDQYHYCNFENEHGSKIGIADAKEMGITPGDRKNNTVVLQFQVPDVKDFFQYLQEHDGVITFGPSFDEKGQFWYGGFHDLEGNPFWVVDENCP